MSRSVGLFASRAISIVVLILFAIGLLAALVNGYDMDQPDEFAHGDFLLRWTTRAIGIFVTTIASLGMLVLAIQGAQWERTIPFIPPVLAGMLLVDIHWTLSLPLGGIVIIYAIAHLVRPFAQPRADNPAQHD